MGRRWTPREGHRILCGPPAGSGIGALPVRLRLGQDLDRAREQENT